MSYNPLESTITNYATLTSLFTASVLGLVQVVRNPEGLPGIVERKGLIGLVVVVLSLALFYLFYKHKDFKARAEKEKSKTIQGIFLGIAVGILGSLGLLGLSMGYQRAEKAMNPEPPSPFEEDVGNVNLFGGMFGGGEKKKISADLSQLENPEENIREYYPNVRV